MSVIVFGNGPLPIEPEFPVMAPGSRTWQIIKTVAAALAEAGSTGEGIIVFGLDEQPRTSDVSGTVTTAVKAGAAEIALTYHPLSYEDFIALEDGKSTEVPSHIRAVIATGSAQPYSTGARFSGALDLPLWVDVFGDPICETQSQQEITADPSDMEAAATRMVHVWKLFVDALLQGDRFSTLSDRQRSALIGQLGCAGRLNQHTAPVSLVDSIPYGLFLDELKLSPPETTSEDRFTVMWSGSFNTWMDVPTLTAGIADALKSDPSMRLLVVGGRIEGYNEVSYEQFVSGIKEAGVEGAVTLMDWQPLSAMQTLYNQCDLGISIDRFTYEAELGSRTRLINFLAAGVPVASTVVTELSKQLLDSGNLVPFELGSAASLTDTLTKAASNRRSRFETAKAAIKYVYTAFNGNELGEPLKEWIKKPHRSADKGAYDTNMLFKHTQALRESLGK